MTFAHKVAVERDYIARHPGAVYCVMLQRDEAEGLLAQIQDLVAGEGGFVQVAREPGKEET